MYIYPRKKLDISYRDIASGMLCCIRQAFRPYSVDKLKSKIADYFSDQGYGLVGLSCRTIFNAYLETLSLDDESEIIFSEINIPHMVDIAQHNRLKIKTVAIHPRTLCVDLDDLKRQINTRTKVIVIAHLFGALTNITDVANYLSEQHPHIKLIEDYAEAYIDARSYQKCAYADLSMISFGKIKSKTALGGGIGIVKDRQAYQTLRNKLSSYPLQGNLLFIKRLLFTTLLKIISIPCLYYLTVKFICLVYDDYDSYIINISRGFKQGDLVPQLYYQLSSSQFRFLARRIISTQNKTIMERKKVGEYISRSLSSLVIGGEAQRRTWWIVPITIQDPKRYSQMLLSYHVDSTSSSSQLRYLGDNSTHWFNNIVYLPAYYSRRKTLEKNIVEHTHNYLDSLGHAKAPTWFPQHTTRIHD